MVGQVRQYWRRFKDHAESIETAPAFDPRSRPLYAMILVALLIEIAVLAMSDFVVPINALVSAFVVLAWVAVAGLMFRRYGSRKVSGMLEAFALPPIVGALTAISTVFLTTISLPFADTQLDAADKAIGFDWLSLFAYYQRYPALLNASDWAYSSIYLQLSVIAVALFATNRSDRGWTFMTAWAVASVITVLIYPFFPAAGPYLTYGIAPQDIRHFDVEFPWSTGPIIESIRDGSLRDLGRAMTGLVSFPSFHFAAAVLYAWAIAPVAWLRFPLVALNIAMGFATIIIGSHYIVDLIGGGIVAIFAIWVGGWLVRKSTPVSA